MFMAMSRMRSLNLHTTSGLHASESTEKKGGVRRERSLRPASVAWGESAEGQHRLTDKTEL